MVDYNDIFLEKIGQLDKATPDWDDTRIETFLDTQAYLVSRDYSTPWADFDSVPDNYKYPVTIYAAIKYWWNKAGEYAAKFDQQVGSNTSQKSSQMFYRVLEMIDYLTKELEKEGKKMLDETSSGDIIVGDLIKRSKFSGYLIPREEDAAGDWTS